jgi:O-acetyl-ADP-ribose deacetylase (regulator of RNase III)
MRWVLKQKNILDEPADILICSANVHLSLSGGVGADLLGRYGGSMQTSLEQLLRSRNPRCAQRGEVFQSAGPEIPYKAILHAVAIDGWYDSTPEVVTGICRRALRMSAELGARTVALTALATGFGKLSLAEFAEGVRPLASEEFPPVEQVAICLQLDFQIAELSRHLPGFELASDLQTS